MSAPEQIATGTVVLGEDFAQHRIRGTVVHAVGKGISPYLDVPLISHVEGGLWQGGCEPGVLLPDGFDHVISVSIWDRYLLPEGTTRTEIKMYDALDQTFEQVEGTATAVFTRLKMGQTVLVHCQAGLNRSGLIAARALMLMGHTADSAITKLRDQRSPLVLCNETFENYLRSL